MTAAAQHNGGRGQTNLHYAQTSGSFPFLNCARGGGGWGGSGYELEPDQLDDNGMPLSIPDGKSALFVFFIPTQMARPGRYVFKWPGNGHVGINMVGTYVEGSASSGVTVSGFQNSQYTSTEGSGRVLIENPDQAVVLTMTTQGSPRITDIIWVHEDDEAALDNGEMFSPKFLASFAEGGFGVIRFLNWFNINQTHITTWASRKPLSYRFWGGGEARASIYGRTSGTSSAYTMSAPSGWNGLVHGATVIARFHATATGACTLNVDDTGAKNILGFACSALDTSTYPTEGVYGTCVYDINLGAWIKLGGDSSGMGSPMLDNGVPPETMIRLCAEAGAHIYAPIPHMALTPMTDFVPEFSDLFISMAPGWMKLFAEATNELFNFFFGFNQAAYAKAVATSWGWEGGFNHYGWAGKATSTLGQAVANAFGVAFEDVKNQDKFYIVGAVQTGGDLSPGGSQAERFESSLYLDPSSDVQDGYEKIAAKEFIRHIAPANYFSPSIYNTQAEFNLADQFAGIEATVNVVGDQMTIVQGSSAGIGCTVSNASPGVITCDNRFAPNEPVSFSQPDGATLPTQIVAGTICYVSETGLSKNALSVSATPGGVPINTSGGSGTVIIRRLLSIRGKPQANLVIRGIGAAGALIPEGTTIVSGSGGTWTLSESLPDTLAGVGIIGGLDWSLVEDYAELCGTPGEFAVPTVAARMAATKALAQSVGVDRMCCYEGGLSPDYRDDSSLETNIFRAASLLSEKMAKATMQNYDSLFALSDENFTFEFPSAYIAWGGIHSDPNGIIRMGSAWPVMQDIFRSPKTPQWKAIELYNNGSTKLTVRT